MGCISRVLTAIFRLAKQSDPVFTLHSCRDTITQKFRFGSQLADNFDVISGGDVEKSGHRWMMGHCRSEA